MSVPQSRISKNVHLNEPSLMPAQPWWKNLNINFNKISDGFYLSGSTKMIVNTLASIDIAGRSTVATLLSTKALKKTFSPEQMKYDIDHGRIYRDLASKHDASLVFAEPPMVTVTEILKEKGYSAPDTAICIDLEFDSPYKPINPEMTESYSSQKNNLKAKAQYWRHDKDEARPTVCVIHGFLLSSYNANAHIFEMKRFFEQGYDILFYTLPHHGTRQEKGAFHSGFGYFSSGLSWLNESILHSVFDFRIFLNYLETQGVPQFGVTGFSLGGYTASLLASVDNRLAFSIPNVPVSCIADLFMLWNPVNKMLQKSLVLSNTSLYQMRHTIAVHSPLTYKPVIDKERLLIIAGVADRCVPPNQARIIWDHWQRPEINWFAGGHVTHVEKNKYLKDIDNLFKKIGFTV